MGRLVASVQTVTLTPLPASSTRTHRRYNVQKLSCLVDDFDSFVYACGFMAEQKTHYVIYTGGKEDKILFTDRDKRVVNKWVKEQDKYDPEHIELDMSIDVDPIEHCLANVKKAIEAKMEYSGCDRYIILLTKGGSCFRTNLARIQRYKGNRMGTAKPYHYDNIREYLVKHHGAKVYRKWEADDAACMIMTRGDTEQYEYILSAIDKDLDMVRGRRMNPNKRGQPLKECGKFLYDDDGNQLFAEDWGVYEVEEWDAEFSFYKQMLSGDKADNIKGLSGTKGHPGIGDTKAKKMLENCKDGTEMCQVVMDAYRKKYGDEPFELIPWWWDDMWLDEEKYGADDVAATKALRKNHPVFGKAKKFTVTWVDMFQENADLLWMLRTKTDQYTPPIEVDGWNHYEMGTAQEYFRG